MKKYLKHIAILILFLAMSYIYIAFVLHNGIVYAGSDRMFHIERLEEAYQTLKSGHIVSLISTFSFLRIGQAINIFYPWINLIPYAIIRLIVVKPVTAYYLFMMLEQFLGLVIAYFCILKLTKNIKSSVIFAIIYRFSAYMMINDFARADIGEAWATIFIPIVFLGSYMIFTNDKQKGFQGSVLLALGLICITYCHILTAIITIGILSVVYILLVYFQKKRLYKFICLLVSVGIYILGSLVIIYPMLDTMLNTKILMPNLEYLGSYNITLDKLLTKSLENSLDSNIPHVGWIIVLIILIGLFFFEQSDRCQRFIYILGITIVCMATVIFPWSLLSKTPLRVIQFPWRILPFGILLIVFYLISQNKFKSLRWYYSILVGVLVLITVISTEANFVSFQNKTMNVNMDYVNPWRNLLKNKDYNKILSTNYNYLSTAAYTDYIPKNSESVKDDIFHHVVLINGEKKEINYTHIKSLYQGIQYNIKLKDKYSTIILPFFIYNKDDYNVYINGKKIKEFLAKDGRIVINCSNSGKVGIRVKYNTPWSYIIVRFISAITVIGIVVYLIYGRLKRTS